MVHNHESLRKEFAGNVLNPIGEIQVEHAEARTPNL